MPKRVTFIVSLVLFLLAAPAARADVVTMKDGRRFEGTIVSESGQSLSIDAMISGIRATLRLDKAQTASVERRALPAGFYDPPPAEARVSDPTKFTSGQPLYLEVPIKGKFGQDVFAEGVAAVMRYAMTHRIEHVVFVVDSTGGDIDEARAMYERLKAYRGKVATHALVKQCLGDALAIPIGCDSMTLVPGATIGGTLTPAAERSDRAIDPKDEAVLRAQVAAEAAADLSARGRPGDLARAMIDPSDVLAAWRDSEGKVHRGSTVPDDVPADRVIFKVGQGEVLVLKYEQALQLGMRPFTGTVQDLGAYLGVDDWRLESAYGTTAMLKTAQREQARASAAQAAYDAKVKNNVSRRAATEKYIEDNLKYAAQFDPRKGSYATYKVYVDRWHWGWGWGGGDPYSGGGGGDSYETNRLTTASQRQWRDRSDACIHFLTKALEGAQTMQRLDREAAGLNLAPTYDPTQLEDMIKDLKLKLTLLAEYRIKTSN